MKNSNGTCTFTTGYMDDAVFNLEMVLEKMLDDVVNHLDDFDTLVGTGFSGSLVIPAMAHMLNKKFLLLRKEDDDSHHGGGRPVGALGKKWLFVDDFVSSGSTKRRVQDKVDSLCFDNQFDTEFVGDYLYACFSQWARYRPLWRLAEIEKRQAEIDAEEEAEYKASLEARNREMLRESAEADKASEYAGLTSIWMKPAAPLDKATAEKQMTVYKATADMQTDFGKAYSAARFRLTNETLLDIQSLQSQGAFNEA